MADVDSLVHLLKENRLAIVFQLAGNCAMKAVLVVKKMYDGS